VSVFWTKLLSLLSRSAPYWSAFLLSLVFTLLLVPPVRALNRRLGMVDQPGPRRINQTPIPRGGGLAVFLALVASVVVWYGLFGIPQIPGYSQNLAWGLWGCNLFLVVLGYLDDKFSLRPRVKLAGQVLVALAAHFGCGLGFENLFPEIPPALDAVLTVLWIVGAINAFNLIDGLDGLATGLSAIAVLGMAGALVCVDATQMIYCHLAVAGACFGFLRYNFHPASVFLGDSGSMFLGFVVASLPLVTGVKHSFLVSVGVPILAMGVPVFDTSLAILRRLVRAALSRAEKGRDEGNGKVMTADVDHLHHRLLRRFVSQRKTALALYLFALLLVGVGVGGVMMQGRAVALYIVGFIVVAVVVFRDMRRIELWDASRLLGKMAHDTSLENRQRLRIVRVPLLVALDLGVLVAAWFLGCYLLGLPVNSDIIHSRLVLRGVPIFLALVFFRAYATYWPRAVLSNFVRLVLAIVVGTAASGVIVVMGKLPHTHFVVFSITYAALVFAGLLVVRKVRGFLRDLFYLLDCGRLLDDPATSRVLVYGAGLRYRSFRNELVRAASANKRVIVGLLDDDILLRGEYIGGQRIHGSLADAPAVIRKLRIDAVVIACVLSPERLAEVRRVLASCGVKVTYFTFSEKEI